MTLNIRKYQHKTGHVVEAVLFTGDNGPDIIKWCGEGQYCITGRASKTNNKYGVIETEQTFVLHDTVAVAGDYIVKGNDDTFWIVELSQFMEIYVSYIGDLHFLRDLSGSRSTVGISNMFVGRDIRATIYRNLTRD